MTDTLDRPPALVLDGDALDPIGGGGALVGYGRVSTKGQNLDRQMLALREAGCQKIFSDKKSGKNVEREELWKCLATSGPVTPWWCRRWIGSAARCRI